MPLVRRRSATARPAGGRLTGTVLGALVAVVLVATSLVLQSSVPRPDAFYDAPDSVPAQPGQLLRSEPYTNAGVLAGAKAWRILYTTTRDEGQPALASGLVIAPANATGKSASATPSKVIAWAHGTTGFATGCAPSILPAGLSSGAMMIQDKVVAEGWTMVATDYVGLGTDGPHSYLIGQGEGRSVLDAIRAAHQLQDVELAADTVIWGHSQGGHAALWAGILAPRYAPELTIDGVAALAPASNLPGLITNLGKVTGGALFASFVVAAYAATYPDVTTNDYIRPGARILTREMGDRCLSGKSSLVSLLTTLSLDKPIWSGNPGTGAFGQRLRDNVPSGPIKAPVFIGQGAADTLILPATQAEYVDARCAAGYPVDYRTYEGRDHVPLVEPDSPAVRDLLTWTTDRFGNKPTKNTC
ncbi:lipase family protein [Kribbella sp. NPDC004875]|uniref:lipase family protein n=1 Tax=Kribbella sp. NPDC004875 TaxID=3364107 RepID=UPI0036BDAED3